MKIKNFSMASIAHIIGGFIIGLAGFMGATAMWLILERERYQEQETYGFESDRPLTNIAWSDLGEWGTGAIIGLVVHIVGVVYFMFKIIQ